MVRAGARRGGACASPLTCARSNGLLYAAEEPAEKKLIYECKNCHFRKDATNARVYVHYLKNKPMCVRPAPASGRAVFGSRGSHSAAQGSESIASLRRTRHRSDAAGAKRSVSVSVCDQRLWAS